MSSRTAVIFDEIITRVSDCNNDADLVVATYHFAGYCYSRLGDYGKAMNYYQQVLAGWPRYRLCWNVQWLIADCYERMVKEGILPKAEAEEPIEEAYKVLLGKYGGGCCLKDYAMLKLGALYSERKQNEEAARYYMMFLGQVDPNDSRVEYVKSKLSKIIKEAER